MPHGASQFDDGTRHYDDNACQMTVPVSRGHEEYSAAAAYSAMVPTIQKGDCCHIQVLTQTTAAH